MVAENIFFELSLIIILAVAVSILVRVLKQPLIIGYIICGILISPYFFNLMNSHESLETFAKMGVAVLLFMVGLGLDPKSTKDVGKVAIITGLGQIIFTVIVGFFISLALGFSPIVAIYLALAISFSSTIIVIKFLSDKGDTHTLYGKISISFLIVQDLVAILILMIVSSLNGSTDFSSFAIQKVLLGAGMIGALFLFSIFILKPVTKIIAKSQELLLLFSVGWAFALASLFAYAGFSIEIGALLAGVSLSVSHYRHEISSKMKPLRDFFLLIFFILLGSQLHFGNVANMFLPILVLSAIVIVGNPIIMMTLMGFLGYTKRTSFFSGLAVSQISEFSFILIALGVSVGHLNGEILSLITLIGLITMACSTYAMNGSNSLYKFFSKPLEIFERKGRKIDESKYHSEQQYDVILFGYNRIGYSLKETFGKMKKSILIVDNNPEVIQKLVRAGVSCRYGDAANIELLNELPLSESKLVLSTIPDLETNILLLKETKRMNKDAIFMAVSHQIDDAIKLYDSGADFVIMPHFLGGAYTAQMIEKSNFDKKKFLEEAAKNRRELLHRKKEGQKDVMHERD